MEVINIAPYNSFVRRHCLERTVSGPVPTRPLNKPVTFRSSFIEPEQVQSAPITVQQFKRIVDIMTPIVPNYAQYLKDQLAEYTNFVRLNIQTPEPVYVEQMKQILKDMNTQTEWSSKKQLGDISKKVIFGVVEPFSKTVDGTSSTQTSLLKPASGSGYLPKFISKSEEVFYEGDDNIGTITGTPTSRLSAAQKLKRPYADAGSPSTPVTRNYYEVLTDISGPYDTPVPYDTPGPSDSGDREDRRKRDFPSDMP